ncbi:hypothetical protein LEP1GSC133_1493 [Leptospira borgpetersenii serovar Pomona str. 200901868]|uniref:Uncharacterized protein n=2 Tax=Leptospira borgpetersenii TaxID=174 RepID=A0A0S2IWT3_LEPBO|nr:hypothetical protein LBBP_03933 [Leptospira borgpetersenii serovar Ballum]EKR00882.1 hypothetical protein LEP1GSC121_0183 [Leptospira borgpetersenii serovar Castellonis str. 200801910]EMO11889.1 hypothetical protein LEP1GSC137_0963 [Leptospira borgpetersenii str. Noumea 25]EMO65250.1 hypothetical protein LEP1GSC133_1493 [Leptospira borgpetersenii serovar Pomona str. 200901868]
MFLYERCRFKISNYPFRFLCAGFYQIDKKMFFTLRIFHTLACRTIYRRLPNACREN